MPSSRGSSDPRLNPCFLCLLHWQAGSLPLCHLGSPTEESSSSLEIHILRPHPHPLGILAHTKVGETVRVLPADEPIL